MRRYMPYTKEFQFQMLRNRYHPMQAMVLDP